MGCEPFEITLPDGTKARGFVCSRGRRKPSPKCDDCGNPTGNMHALCDWKLTGEKKGKTCSRVLCQRCTTEVAENKDLCRAHAAMWAKHPANPRNATP